nr:hypothetical protein [Tanacetum cinerariifolium]
MQPYTPRCIQNYRKEKDHDIKFCCSNDIKSKIKILDHKHAEGTAKNSQDNKVLRHFEEDVFDDEVQRNEAIPLSDEEIALDASSEGTLSPKGPRYDYMMISKAEDDY